MYIRNDEQLDVCVSLAGSGVNEMAASGPSDLFTSTPTPSLCLLFLRRLETLIGIISGLKSTFRSCAGV
jgi:hypothetical protein